VRGPVRGTCVAGSRRSGRPAAAPAAPRPRHGRPPAGRPGAAGDRRARAGPVGHIAGRQPPSLVTGPHGQHRSLLINFIDQQQGQLGQQQLDQVGGTPAWSVPYRDQTLRTDLTTVSVSEPKIGQSLHGGVSVVGSGFGRWDRCRSAGRAEPAGVGVRRRLSRVSISSSLATRTSAAAVTINVRRERHAARRLRRSAAVAAGEGRHRGQADFDHAVLCRRRRDLVDADRWPARRRGRCPAG
jgi:hypothetical protein